MAYRLASLLKNRGYLPSNTTTLCMVHMRTVNQLCTHVQWGTPWRGYHVQVQKAGVYRRLAVQSLANVSVNRKQLRCASTKAMEREQVPLFKRFWRWLHDLDDLERLDTPPDSETQAELDEREAFLSRVQAMYFADPPQTPDLQFCRESLDMLMKYNDRVAVETLWNILPELKVEPDEDLETRVRHYLKKAKLEAYYE